MLTHRPLAMGRIWNPSTTNSSGLTGVSSMQRHDGTSKNIFRPNLSEAYLGLWNLHLHSTSACLKYLLASCMLDPIYSCPLKAEGLCFVSCPPNHLEGGFWTADRNAKWVWLFNDNAVTTEAISLDLLWVIHIESRFMNLHVQIHNVIIIYL